MRNGGHFGRTTQNDFRRTRRCVLAMDPTTWPEQIALAAAGKMDELKAWQEDLKGGREE